MIINSLNQLLHFESGNKASVASIQSNRDSLTLQTYTRFHKSTQHAMKQTSKRSVPQASNAERTNFTKAITLLAAQKQRKSNQNYSANIQKSACYDSLITEDTSPPPSFQNSNLNQGHQQHSFVILNPSFVQNQQASQNQQSKQSHAQQRLCQLLDQNSGGTKTREQRTITSNQTHSQPECSSVFVEQHNLTEMSPSRKTRQPLETRTRITTHLLTEGSAPVTTAHAASMLDNSQYCSFKQQKNSMPRAQKQAQKAQQFPLKHNDLNYQGERDKAPALGIVHQSTTFDGSKGFAQSSSGSKPKTPQVTQQASSRATMSPGQRQKLNQNSNQSYLQFPNYHPLNTLMPQERHSSSGSAAQVFIQQVKEKIQQTRHKSKQPSFSNNSQNVSQLLNQQDSLLQEQQILSMNPQSVKNTNYSGFAHEKNSKSMLVSKTCFESNNVHPVSPTNNEHENVINFSHNISSSNNNSNPQIFNNVGAQNTQHNKYQFPNSVSNSNPNTHNNSNSSNNNNNNNNSKNSGSNTIKFSPNQINTNLQIVSQFNQSPSIQSLQKKQRLQLDFLHPSTSQARAQTQTSSRRDGALDSQKSSANQMHKNILGYYQKSQIQMPISMADDSAGTQSRQYILNQDHHSKSSPKLPINKGHDSVRMCEDILEEFQQKNKFSLDCPEQYFENFFTSLQELQRITQLSGKQQISVSHNTTSTLFQSSSTCSSSSEKLFDSLRQIIAPPIISLIIKYNSYKQQAEGKRQQEKREKEMLEMKVGMLQQERDKLLHLTGALSKQQMKNESLLKEKDQLIMVLKKQQQNSNEINLRNSASDSLNIGTQEVSSIPLSNLRQVQLLIAENNRLKESLKKQTTTLHSKRAKEQMLLNLLNSHNISNSFVRTPDSLESPLSDRGASHIPETRMSLPNQQRQTTSPIGKNNFPILSQGEYSPNYKNTFINKPDIEFEEFLEENSLLDCDQQDDLIKNNTKNNKQKKGKAFMLSSQNETDTEEEKTSNFSQQLKEEEDEGDHNEDSQDDYRNQFYLKDNNKQKYQNSPINKKQPSLQIQMKFIQKTDQSNSSSNNAKQQVILPMNRNFKKLQQQQQLTQQLAQQEEPHLSIVSKTLPTSSYKHSPLNKNNLFISSIQEEKNHFNSHSEKSITDSESDVISIPINDHAYASQASKLMSTEGMKEKLKINLGCLQSKDPPKEARGEIPKLGQNEVVGYHDEFMNRFDEFSQSWRDAINAERRYNDPQHSQKYCLTNGV